MPPMFRWSSLLERAQQVVFSRYPCFKAFLMTNSMIWEASRYWRQGASWRHVWSVYWNFRLYCVKFQKLASKFLLIEHSDWQSSTCQTYIHIFRSFSSWSCHELVKNDLQVEVSFFAGVLALLLVKVERISKNDCRRFRTYAKNSIVTRITYCAMVSRITISNLSLTSHCVCQPNRTQTYKNRVPGCSTWYVCSILQIIFRYVNLRFHFYKKQCMYVSYCTMYNYDITCSKCNIVSAIMLVQTHLKKSRYDSITAIIHITQRSSTEIVTCMLACMRSAYPISQHISCYDYRAVIESTHTHTCSRAGMIEACISCICLCCAYDTSVRLIITCATVCVCVWWMMCSHW